jgi:flagellin
MALVVNTNTQSIFAQRALRNNTSGLERNIEHLSTGYRINRAADDAAGLSISNKLTTSIKGLEKAKQNAGDGISLIQTAEGGLQVIQDNIQRIRELFVQAINGTNGENERAAIQREINERIKTIDDIAKATKFNGNSLLSGGSSYTLQTGSENGQTTTLSFASGSAANTGIDIDITYERATGSTEYGQLAEGVTVGFALDELSVGSTTVYSYDGSVSTETSNGVGQLDTMIDNISRMRSYLGASQNALESKIEYMDIALENAQASRSRIQDVDVAYESSVLVKNQILQQTAASMLSQANTTPQIALQLIGR